MFTELYADTKMDARIQRLTAVPVNGGGAALPVEQRTSWRRFIAEDTCTRMHKRGRDSVNR